MSKSSSLILVADTHVRPGSNAEFAFFRMLEKLGDSRYDVIFLGDIFELWIALPAYEEPSHARFLKWCRQQLARRRIGFIEGNHEFFVSSEHGNHFSWSTEGSYWRDTAGNLYVHGDQINRRDSRYLQFRRLTKNRATKALLRLLPAGHLICSRLNQMLRKTNPHHRQGVPEGQIQEFARHWFADGIERIFIGHFHTASRYQGTSTGLLYLLPAWLESGQVTRVNPNNVGAPVEFIDWQRLST